MKLNFVGKDIYKSFNLVSSLVPTSSMKQVLRGVKMEAKTDIVELTATDLEVAVKYRIPLSLLEFGAKGCIVLPAVRVSSILGEWAKNEEVSILVEGNSCTLKSKGGHFKMVCEDARNFPEIHVNEIKSFVEIEGETLSDMIGKVMHAVAKGRVFGVLGGIFVKICGEELVVVAMDGNRLSCVKRKASNPGGVLAEGVVTVKCLSFLQRFVLENNGVLKVGLGKSQVRFVSERGEIVSQLIEGIFKRYELYIPKGNDKKAEINKKDLLSKVRMASFMTNEGYRAVKFLFRDGKLTLVSKAAEIGESELEVSAQYEGPDFEISFNPDYVLDALKTSDNETVILELGDSETAALFRTGHGQLCVVMPVKQKKRE